MFPSSASTVEFWDIQCSTGWKYAKSQIFDIFYVSEYGIYKQVFLTFFIFKCLVLISESILQYFGHKYMRFQTFSFSRYSHIIRDILIIYIIFLFRSWIKMPRYTRQTVSISYYGPEACNRHLIFGQTIAKLTDLMNFSSFANTLYNSWNIFYYCLPLEAIALACLNFFSWHLSKRNMVMMRIS